jgi:hypothetical protein
MLLIPFRIPYNGDLRLEAYSNNNREIESVTITLERIEVQFASEIISNGNRDRKGKRFTINQIYINRLENYLRVRFIGNGNSTVAKSIADFSGRSFKCERVDSPPFDCQTIYANNNHEALVKCALVASSNNWFGGVSNPGECGN